MIDMYLGDEPWNNGPPPEKNCPECGAEMKLDLSDDWYCPECGKYIDNHDEYFEF